MCTVVKSIEKFDTYLTDYEFNKENLERMVSYIEDYCVIRTKRKQRKYDETVYFYPIQKIDECIKGKGKVNFLTGLKLALASPDKQKIEIVLAWFTQENIELIKTYVILCGFDVAIVKAD